MLLLRRWAKNALHYVNFAVCCNCPEPRTDHKRGFTPKRFRRIWNFPTRLLPAQRINPSCSRKAQLVYLAIRQCTGNRRCSGREAGDYVNSDSFAAIPELKPEVYRR